MERLRLKLRTLDDILADFSCGETELTDYMNGILPQRERLLIGRLVGAELSADCRICLDDGTLPYMCSENHPSISKAAVIGINPETGGYWLLQAVPLQRMRMGVYDSETDDLETILIDLEQFLRYTDVKRQYLQEVEKLSGPEKYSLMNEFKDLCKNISERDLWTSLLFQRFLFRQIGQDEEARDFLLQFAEEHAKAAPFHTDIAAGYYIKALEIVRRQWGEDNALAIELCRKIGTIYCCKKQFARALEYLESGMKAAERCIETDPELLFTAYHYMSCYYSSKGLTNNDSQDLMTGMEYEYKKLNYCRERFPDDLSKEAACYYGIGFDYSENLKNDEEAVRYLSMASELARQSKTKGELWIGDCRKRLASCKKKLEQKRGKWECK